MACFPLSGLALDSVNEFPDPIEVFQKKVRYYITWGYSLKSGSKVRFFCNHVVFPVYIILNCV